LVSVKARPEADYFFHSSLLQDVSILFAGWCSLDIFSLGITEVEICVWKLFFI
jgi:hypothetical protein